MRIPRIIHQVWVGEKPFPKEYEKQSKKFIKLNKSFEYFLWTEENIKEFKENSYIFEKLRCPAERADIIRLLALQKYGGYYFDADFKPLKSLEMYEKKFSNYDFIICDLTPGRVNNAFMASLPNTNLINSLVKNIKPRKFYGYDKYAAGPLYVDTQLKKWTQKDQFLILQPEYCYAHELEITDNTFAIHTCGRTWKDDRGWKNAALSAERRLHLAKEENKYIQNKLDLLNTQNNKTQRGFEISKNPDFNLADLKALRALEIYFKNYSNYLFLFLLNRILSKLNSLKRFKPQSMDRILRIVYKFFSLFQLKILTIIVIYLKKKIRKKVLVSWSNIFKFLSFKTNKILHRDYLIFKLNKLNNGLVGAEIGVQKGIFSKYILDTLKIKNLYLIDPWSHDTSGKYKDTANVIQKKQDLIYKTALYNTRSFSNKTILRKTSLEASNEIENESLDFVYIDARHDYKSVKEDIDVWYPKVKKGGYVCGHDYLNGFINGSEFGVIKAVNEFIQENNIPRSCLKRTYEPWPSFYFKKV